MKNLKTFENFDDFDSEIQPEEFTPEPSMDEVPVERDLATDIRAILDEELYTGPGSHPDSTTVLGVDEAIDRILKLIDGGVEGDQ